MLTPTEKEALVTILENQHMILMALANIVPMDGETKTNIRANLRNCMRSTGEMAVKLEKENRQ